MSAIVETDWGEIYTDYYDKIFSYIARRVRYIDICEELTSEVFAKAIEATGNGIGSQSSFSGWLFRIAHNLIIDHYRARDRQQEIPLENIIELVNPDDDPVTQTELVIEFEQALAAIARLTEEQQKVLQMHYLDDCDFDEIAESLDKKRDAIKALLFRALTGANRLLGGTGRPSKEPGKTREIKEVLCERGPLRVSDIAAIADIPARKITSALYARNSIFCKVGATQNGRVTIYIWGVIGVHDKGAA